MQQYSKGFLNSASENVRVVVKKDTNTTIKINKRKEVASRKKLSLRPKLESVVVPIKKEEVRAESVKKKKFNYPSYLGRSIPGDYHLFINREDVAFFKVTESKKVLILSATGCFKYLTDDGVNNIWYVPSTAIKKGFFVAPEWMEDDQRKWTICAIREIHRLLCIFEARMKRKREEKKSLKNKKYK